MSFLLPLLTTLFSVVSVGPLTILSPASQHLIGITLLFSLLRCLNDFRFTVAAWLVAAQELRATILARSAAIQVRLRAL